MTCDLVMAFAASTQVLRDRKHGSCGKIVVNNYLKVVGTFRGHSTFDNNA